MSAEFFPCRDKLQLLTGLQTCLKGSHSILQRRTNLLQSSSRMIHIFALVPTLSRSLPRYWMRKGLFMSEARRALVKPPLQCCYGGVIASEGNVWFSLMAGIMLATRGFISLTNARHMAI